MHAFEITTWLERRSSGRLDVTNAALLQALHRLEARGLLAAEWGESGMGGARATTGLPQMERRTSEPSPRRSWTTLARSRPS